jgi:endonuclease YncB( thermonuclease family)
MMKLRVLCTFGILLALLLCVSGQQPGQQKPSSKISFEFEDECGDPTMESMVWISIEGTVVEIIAGDLVKLQDNRGKQRMVSLVAVDAASAKDASGLLSDVVLNRKVDVMVNPSNSTGYTLVGVVHLRGKDVTKDVNRELIEAGAAKYKQPAAYSVSGYTACVYRIVERKAREAGKGVWQRADP